MCGIFGAISGRGAPDLNVIKTLGILNQERGEDSCGISYGHNLVKGVDKEAKWINFIKKQKIEFKSSDHVVIGHVRKKTQGIASINNAHPFKIPVYHPDKNIKDYCLIGAHNGNITNWRELCKEKDLDPLNYDVDSQAAFALIAKSFRAGNYEFFKKYVGKAALVWTFSDEDALYFFHGKSMDNNNTTNPSVSEERPLHYWVDSKKNVTYFSSEAGPLEAIATDNAEIVEVPFNKILRVTSSTIEVVAEIPRDTKSYQFFYEYAARNSAVNSSISTRKVDNGEFDKRALSNVDLSKSNNVSGIIEISNEILVKYGYKPVYENLMDIYNLEDRDEHDFEDGHIVFARGRYYKNGHLVDGPLFLSEQGKILNKRVTKKLLTVSERENGENVAYSKYYFSDGLLFKSEKDYKKYLAICDKGLAKSESRRLPAEGNKPRVAHGDFIRRVIKEGVRFGFPVSTLDMTNAKVFLPDGENTTAGSFWDGLIKFTQNKFMVKDGELIGVIYPKTKCIHVDKQKVIFSVPSVVKPKVQPKPLDVIILFDETECSTKPTKERIPWTDLLFDYKAGVGYRYSKETESMIAVVAFWPVSEEDYNSEKHNYYSPIQWASLEYHTSIAEFNELLVEIHNKKDLYLYERKKFFECIAWYNKLEPFEISNYRDVMSLKKINYSAHEEVESYTEPVNDKTLVLQAKQFLDLCQVAGKPANADAAEFVDADYFIDWSTNLLWEPLRDENEQTTHMEKAYRFALKSDAYNGKPILLTRLLANDIFYSRFEVGGFVDYLRTSNIESVKSDFIAKLANRGYSLIGLNDYDALIDEEDINAHWSNSYDPAPPVNGNLIPDDQDYLSKKIEREDAMDAEALKKRILKEIAEAEKIIQGGIMGINKFLAEHPGTSLQKFNLTEVMSTSVIVQRALAKLIETENPRRIITTPLSDQEKILISLNERERRKIIESYLKLKNTKEGDILAPNGKIFRFSNTYYSKTGKSAYSIAGSWKFKIVDGSIVVSAELYEGSAFTNITQLEDVLSVSLEEIHEKFKTILLINKEIKV